MTKFRKPLLFTFCLIPVGTVGGWFTAQMSAVCDTCTYTDAYRQQNDLAYHFLR